MSFAPTFVIAEAGVNHNGSVEKAIQLIDAAVDAGADAVKFQTFKADNLVTESAKQADYQTENTGQEQSQYQLLKSLELSEMDHFDILSHCKNNDIEFMSTAFDEESVIFLHDLGMKRWKIPSGELLSVPYLRQIAEFNQPTVLSTGMGNLDEVEFSIETLLKAGLEKQHLTVLHANTAYPTPYEDVNLRAMQTLASQFGVKVGLSDHSLGIEVPIAAVAMGATIIEKHFTLDKTLPGPDHKASLEPDELKAMVQGIRRIELALGSGKKQLSESEAANVSVARKRLVAATPIAKGDAFTANNVTLKRSESGAFAQEWDKVIGQMAERDYQVDEGI